MKLRILPFFLFLILSCFISQNSVAQWLNQSFSAGSGLESKPVNDVHFLNASLGVVVLSDASGAYTITVDGGDNWLVSNTGLAEHLLAAQFVDANTLFVIGADASFSTYYILRSVNGGSSFQGSPFSTTKKLNDIYFTNTQTGYASASDGTVYQTNDGGDNWNPMNFPDPGENITGIHFPDDSVGFAVTDSAKMYVTTNGQDWSRQFSYVGHQGNHHSVFFTDIDHGYAVGGTSISYTSNGGANWNTTNTSPVHLFGIHMLDQDHGFAVGQLGNYVETFDGFQNVSASDFDTIGHAQGHTLRAVHMVNDVLGFKVGDSGRLLKYYKGTISGNVVDASQTAVNDGWIYLIKARIFAGEFPITDSVQLTAGGAFAFNNVEAGIDYLIKVNPADTQYLPSFYGPNFFWDRATRIFMDDDITGLNVEILDATPASLNGTGSISGQLIEHDPSGKRGPGDPITDEPLTLIDSGDSSVVSTTNTDQLGEFEFQNVPDGDYQLYYEKIGVPVQDHDISISPTDSVFENINIEVDTANNIIIVELGHKTGISLTAANNGLTVFPNPASGTLFIELAQSLENGSLSLTLLDISGKVHQQQVYPVNQATQQLPVDIRDLDPGIYLLEIRDDNYRQYHTKVVVTD